MSVEVISRKIIKEDLPEDEFSASGPYIGTVLRQIFADVQFPVNDINELLEKAGRDRLIYLDHEKYGQMIFSLADVVEAIPDTLNFFPIKEKCEVLEKFMKLHKVSRKKGLPTFLSRVNNKNLLNIVSKKPEKEIPAVPVKPFEVTHRELPKAEIRRKIETMDMRRLYFLTQEPEQQKQLKLFLTDFAINIAEFWEQLLLTAATEKALADAQAAEQAAIYAEQAAVAAEQAMLAAASDDWTTSTNGKNTAQSKSSEANGYYGQAESLASSARINAIMAGTPQANTAASQAEASKIKAQAASIRAKAAADRALVLYSIQMAYITVHVLDDDECSGQDNVGSANVSVINQTYSEVASHNEQTGNNGRVTVRGKFGPSMSGPSHILIIAEKEGYQNTTTRTEYGITDQLNMTLPDYDA